MKEIENITKEGVANLEVFSASLQKLAEKDKNIIVVTSDSRGSGKLMPFAEDYPDQIVEVGIAEQSLVGVAAGLSSAGKKVFAVSPACFLTARSLEQIKNDVAYSDNPVNLIGISAGVSYGALGSTHHSLHDFAVLRAINNLTIVAPADNYETEMAIKLASEMPSPVYIRFGKKAMPTLSENKDFEFGKGRSVRKGKDAVIIATGETVFPALQAAIALEEKNDLQIGVVSMHTIKPLDLEMLDRLSEKYSVILTVEEHSVYGGLGEACASYFLQNKKPVKFRIMGIPDEYTVTGSQLEIFEHYGISEEGISEKVLELIS
ncbi:transketolase family protein [Autumnicola psychrophila]|uniref:Transketolase C-terminal domain-containing protein n=1 Tax=Autumnicola psychrophila TaxID=3075592 RepID=A0ABU3DU53_9FLAO|nr:transketolase C-terminal domain-containing protein [Zunongwangia sp. F225]MDT0687234.1 transketolase C-terminal domain-containing protein [Zunongwangia sp. F225]